MIDTEQEHAQQDNATIRKYTGMMRVIHKFTDSREVSRGSGSLAPV